MAFATGPRGKMRDGAKQIHKHAQFPAKPGEE